MRKKGDVYGVEFREEVLERMRCGERVAHLARELSLSESLLYLWRSSAEPWAAGPPGREEEATKENRRLRARGARHLG